MQLTPSQIEERAERIYNQELGCLDTEDINHVLRRVKDLQLSCAPNLSILKKQSPGKSYAELRAEVSG